MHRPDKLQPFDSPADSRNFYLNAKPHKRKWDCPLTTLRIDAYEIVPLTSLKMLKSEGYHMNNCCKDYAYQCAEGSYCVFSIRDHAGNRLATLGAIKNDDYWQFDQCLGPSNSNVTNAFIEHVEDDTTVHVEWQRTEIYYVACEIIRLLNLATVH